MAEEVVAAFFFDIDGTVVEYHTNNWLPGAREELCRLAEAGHSITFITMRGPQDAETEWSVYKTYQLLHVLPFHFRLITGVPQPRFIIDDGDPHAVRVRTNSAEWIAPKEALQ